MRLALRLTNDSSQSCSRRAFADEGDPIGRFCPGWQRRKPFGSGETDDRRGWKSNSEQSLGIRSGNLLELSIASCTDPVAVKRQPQNVATSSGRIVEPRPLGRGMR